MVIRGLRQGLHTPGKCALRSQFYCLLWLEIWIRWAGTMRKYFVVWFWHFERDFFFLFLNLIICNAHMNMCATPLSEHVCLPHMYSWPKLSSLHSVSKILFCDMWQLKKGPDLESVLGYDDRKGQFKTYFWQTCARYAMDHTQHDHRCFDCVLF
jgi:hypothetical protein